MKTCCETPGNIARLEQLQTAWSQILREVLQRGVHGTAAIEIVVQDGVIQQLKRRIERVER